MEGGEANSEHLSRGGMSQVCRMEARVPARHQDRLPSGSGARSLPAGSSEGKDPPRAPASLSVHGAPEEERVEARKEGEKGACKDQLENKRGPVPSS